MPFNRFPPGKPFIQRLHEPGVREEYPMIPDIKFTKHAENMLKERKLAKSLVIEAIEAPDHTEQGDGNIWHAIKKAGPRFLRVVVSGNKKPYKVVTIYYDRRLRLLNGKKEAEK